MAKSWRTLAKQEVRSTVPVLFGIYVVCVLLAALAPFTPIVDTSVPFTDLYQKKFEGLSGIFRVSAWDAWTNILLFIPYGLLVVLLPVVSTHPWWSNITLAAVSAGLLSFTVELGQLLLPRSPSFADVGFNTLGGLVGGLLGTVACVRVHRLTRRS